MGFIDGLLHWRAPQEPQKMVGQLEQVGKGIEGPARGEDSPWKILRFLLYTFTNIFRFRALLEQILKSRHQPSHFFDFQGSLDPEFFPLRQDSNPASPAHKQPSKTFDLQ
jgi:hypothetical protein